MLDVCVYKLWEEIERWVVKKSVGRNRDRGEDEGNKLVVRNVKK